MDENTHIHHDDESHTHESSNKSNAMLWVGVAVIALLLVGGILMSRKTSPTTENTNTSMEDHSDMAGGTSLEGQGEFNDTEGLENVQEEQPSDETSMESGVVSVEGGMFYFKPDEIRVKKGETVKIVLNNVEGMHDFVIDELNVRTPIVKAGETAEVEFTADEVGEFEYYCSVGNHRQQGMVGTLIVEE